MRTVYLLFGLLVLAANVKAQSVAARLAKAIQQLEGDSQMRHGIVGLEVVNSKSGIAVYSHNSNVGLAAASSQKIITAITAFELLGNDYRFKTSVSYAGTITDGLLTGDLFIKGYGDPTLGSDRYPSTKKEVFFKTLTDGLAKVNIRSVNGNIYLGNTAFSFQPLPGSWIWNDIGNYYGAGSWGLNWRENQYDLVLKPGVNEGDPVEITRTNPPLQIDQLLNQLTTGKKGSGDNGYIYLPPYSNTGFVTGTVPAGVEQFVISGSFADPAKQLGFELTEALQKAGITGAYNMVTSTDIIKQQKKLPEATNILCNFYSPPLDSVVYWFLRKSINLYGEALLKTIAFEKTGFGETDEGLSAVFNFWSKQGVDSNAIKMEDGSGLSPQNRITTKAFTQVMRFARSRPWFNSFYTALPEYNGLKMKSGTIGGAKSFTGYVKSSDGNDYTFAIIVNNYSGKAAQIVAKMYKVLDVLK